jgi:anti-repressor protein
MKPRDSFRQGGSVNAPAIFNNGEFQLHVTPDGDSFHVGAPGLARALGFHEARDLVRALPDDEKGSEVIPTPGGGQLVWFVTEAGFYRVLGQRQTARIKDGEVRAQAARFQDWVFRDVLPAIRRTGAYQVPQQAASIDVSAITKRDLAQMVIAEADRADAAEARVAELIPAAEAWGVLAEATGDYSLRDAAHILNRDRAISTGQNRLMRFLRDEGLVDRRGIPYARHSRHLVERPIAYSHPHTGEPVLKSQIRITVDGLEYLRKRLGGIGQGAT